MIDVTYDQSQSSLPAGFVAAVNYVVNLFESTFTNPVTVNIDVGYGEIAGQSLGSGALGESETYIDSVSYAQATNALKTNGTSAAQQAAYATLPANSPLSGGTLWMATAQEKALGLLPANDTDIDGYVGFSSFYSFSYSATAKPASNQFYFIGVVAHEFSEIMGRTSFLGDAINGTTSYSVMDLFRYSAPSVRDLTATPPIANTAYFSTDNGATDLANWNTNPNGDLGDWASTAGNDAYLAFSPAGQIDSVTTVDNALMNVLGWNSPNSAATVTNGESVFVSAGTTSNGITVLNGGNLEVLSGGTAVAAIVSGGSLQIDAGGKASATVLSSGGQERISSGGTTTATTVSNGGYEVIESGGAATSSTLVSGGYEYIMLGGQVNGAAVSKGGIQNDNGAAINTTLGGFQVVFSGAVASNTTIGGTGYEYILPGGFAGHTVVSLGGIQNDNGTANNTSLGGFQVVFSGATASATVIESGGYQYILPGGVASNTTLFGVQNDDGAANGATISSGGYQIVFAGASASGTIVYAGGFEVVLSGGITSGVTLSGGYVELGGGNGLGNGGVVTFAGDGILKLDDSTHFNGAIAGLTQPDQLDLADINFNSSTTLGFSEAGNNSSGALSVSDGVHTATILLLGQYVAGNFHIATDGTGGTMVTDPPVSVASADTSNVVGSVSPNLAPQVFG